MSEQFNIGDAVTWRSQAGGSTTTKVGKVVCVIKARESGVKAIRTFRRSHSVQWGGGDMRPFDSYLVEVPGGKTARAKPKLYWPVTSVLARA